MNKECVIDWLLSHLGTFGYNDRFLTELGNLIAASGIEKRFFSLMVARLKQLSCLGINAANLEEFENIGGALYSMHISGKGFNIRILYSFLPNREPVLLLAFHERAGKNKTDYTPYLEPAKQRLQAMKEAFNNEQYKI